MRAHARRLTLLVAAAASLPLPARAGGTDIPDNGTEALGRGGAFVAKADDGTALYYNVAGLARQRGTRVTMDANLYFHDMAFTRDGRYPGTAGAATPWAGQPYPTIHDGDSVFVTPFFALSSDLGLFRGLTFGFALYGPSAIGQHDYAGQVETRVMQPNGLFASTLGPSPARFDVTRANLFILEPTWGAAYRVTKWLDVGLAVQWIYGRFGLANANASPPFVADACKTLETPSCDAFGEISVSGNSYGLLLSLLAHPAGWLDVGVNYRPQVDLHTDGTLHAIPPTAKPTQLPDFAVNFNTMLPHTLRVGARVVSHYPDGTERGDVEIDGVYENWSNTRDRWGRTVDDPARKNDHVYSDQFLLGSGTLDVNLNHGYRDTFGVRVGGAYNYRVDDTSRLIGRLGAYHESKTTDSAHTRLDFNTFTKWAFTLGLGYKAGGFAFNVAYAYVYSPNRTVTDSGVRAVSSVNGTNWGSQEPTIIVGNGTYEPSNHILSFGMTVNLNEFNRPILSAH